MSSENPSDTNSVGDEQQEHQETPQPPARSFISPIVQQASGLLQQIDSTLTADRQAAQRRTARRQLAVEFASQSDTEQQEELAVDSNSHDEHSTNSNQVDPNQDMSGNQQNSNQSQGSTPLAAPNISSIPTVHGGASMMFKTSQPVQMDALKHGICENPRTERGSDSKTIAKVKD